MQQRYRAIRHIGLDPGAPVSSGDTAEEGDNLFRTIWVSVCSLLSNWPVMEEFATY